LEALIVGAGHVGTATGALLRARGVGVTYLDADPSVMRSLTVAGEGILPAHPHSGRFELIAVCVPTPTVDGQMSSVPMRAALATCARFVRPKAFTAIAIRSTLLPGTMEGVVRPTLREAAPNDGWAACYWPSFARERMATADELSPRLVCIGWDGDEPLRALFQAVFAAGPKALWTNFATAEFIKHGTNLFNAVKISYFNALDAWASASGADGEVVARAVADSAEGAWNPTYGIKGGRPFGGACLPKDLEAFICYLRANDLPHSRLVEAVQAVNDSFE
jgi:UDPglucose 6-dehydrogenase